MPLNNQRYPSNAPVKVKHYYLIPRDAVHEWLEYVPRFYFEAKIDFADVRSGVRESCSVSHAVHIMAFDGDTVWTRDMVMDVDPALIQTSVPEHVTLRPLPEFVDADAIARAEIQYLQYLLRYCRMRIYRNFALNLYSNSGQTLGDFTLRCVEMLAEPFRHDLDNLHEVFERKLEQIKRKYIKLKELGEFDVPNPTVQFKTILHEVSERIAQMFVSTGLNLDPECVIPVHADLSQPELAERLDSLEAEARNSIEQLLNSYREKVRNIDEYTVHPNLRDIHLARSCILWIPAEEPVP